VKKIMLKTPSQRAVETSPELIPMLEPKWNKYIPIEPSVKQRAFLFLPHAEALYGGAAGGGKSVALLAAALQYVDTPKYSALLLRRTFTDLRLPRALMDLAQEWLGGTDAHWNERDKTWNFPSGATLTFGFLEVERDKYRYQSAAFQFIGFDELTQFTESQYTYMFSRRRRMLDHPVPVRVRSATNPGGEGHEWVHRRFLVEGRKAGRIFIPATMNDNPFLDKEDYLSALNELDPVNKARLAAGDWSIRPEGNMFKFQNFKFCNWVDIPWGKYKWLRYWDLASGGGADQTAGTLLGINPHSRDVIIANVVHGHFSPSKNEEKVRQTAIDDGLGVPIRIEQEPGNSGKTLIENYIRNVIPEFGLIGIPSSGDKVTRANPFSAAVANGRVYVVRDLWTTEYLNELISFPNDGIPDDQVDSSSGAYNAIQSIAPPAQFIQLVEAVTI
jgi:predicted phage terminase large subunit-like protein